MVSIRSEGRRHYIVGDTYSVKDALRSAGCKWDPDARAWWTGKKDEAEALVAKLSEAAPATPAASAPSAGRETLDLARREIAGTGTYKGKTYYLLGRDAGRSAWDHDIRLARSSSGKLKLASRDGKFVFWASESEVQVNKTYRQLASLGSLREFAEERRSHGTDECRCSCHREHNAGKPGSTLYDGCDRCGCEAC